jgi:hypothetical protein
MAVFRLQSLFTGSPRRFGWAAMFGQAGSGGDKRLNAEVRPFQIGFLRTFFISVYDNFFIFTGDSVCQQFPRPVQFGSAKAINIGKPQPQCYFGINLVDILPSRTAGSGKIYFRRGSD